MDRISLNVTDARNGRSLIQTEYFEYRQCAINPLESLLAASFKPDQIAEIGRMFKDTYFKWNGQEIKRECHGLIISLKVSQTTSACLSAYLINTTTKQPIATLKKQFASDPLDIMRWLRASCHESIKHWEEISKAHDSIFLSIHTQIHPITHAPLYHGIYKMVPKLEKDPAYKTLKARIEDYQFFAKEDTSLNLAMRERKLEW